MKFVETPLKGAYVIQPKLLVDARGFFTRTWCAREFGANGLESRLVQSNLSYNRSKGTLRGMHYQAAPFEEAKLVLCTRGALYDVIIDLRQESLTFGKHFGVYLTEENREMVYVPKGFAHGFLTLEDDTVVFYQMSEFYAPGYECGFRWDDPGFGIEWPAEVQVISEKDRSYPKFIPGCFPGGSR
jgi:dTDP-4-dehydrorhamnose 3,5-epimerase